MFKKTAFNELPKVKRPSTYEDYRPTCPHCGQPMHNMGKEFKPPRQRDLKAWRNAEQRHQEIQELSMTSPHSWVRHLGHS
jgi:tRNA(Ile2) C34 agmatinyltransferase TiaS